jgi:O-antigen/teichoic acid export membrane protein
LEKKSKSMSKINTASRLGGQASFFFLGNVFTLLVGLPLQIYVARMLGADGLGTFSLIEGGVSLVAGLIAFGLAPTLVKFIPVHLERGEHACIRKLIGSGAMILLLGGSLVYGLLLLTYPFASQVWPVLADYRTVVFVMGLLIPLSLIAFFLQQGLRGFQEIRYMVLGSSFMQLTVKAALAVLLLTMGFHLLGYVWAVVASVLCACAWMGLGLWRKLTAMPKSATTVCSEANKAWRDYAKVMYSGSLLGMGGAYLDRFLLGFFIGAAPVGVLVVVKQLQQMPVIFLQMFLAVAAPMFSAAHAREDAKERQHIYNLTTDWVVRLSAPLFIFFLLFADPLLNLYGSGFADKGKYALWILLSGQVINLATGPVGNLLNMCGMEKLMLRLSVYQMLISLVGFVVVVPSLGLIGAAIVIAISTIFQNLVALLFARRALGLRWADPRYFRWLAPLAASIAAGIGAGMLAPPPGAAMLVLYLVLLYSVFHGVSLLQGLHNDDRELLGHLRVKLGLAKAGAA